MMSSRPALSVVIATYNRAAGVERLLMELAQQTLAAETFEVVVVDDGSVEPVVPRLTALSVPYSLTVLAQANAGPAAARDRAIRTAIGEIVVCLDDDMRVAPGFLTAHLNAHPAGSRNVVLGRVHANTDPPLTLHERMHMKQLDHLADRVAQGKPAGGSSVYSGNVSFRRADYIAVGGFDLSLRISEDAELGIRFEKSGAAITLSNEASAVHASDHSALSGWMRRAVEYGAADSKVSEKHPDLPSADPWRFLLYANPISSPLMLAGIFAPRFMYGVAWLGMRLSNVVASLGAERIAIAGATLAYGILYYSGVRRYAGSLRGALRGFALHLNRRSDAELRFFAKIAKLHADIYADHLAIRRSEAKYKGKVIPVSRLPIDFVQRIGFQMMVAYRFMRYFRSAGLGIFAKITSRMIRHLYGADIHWDAEFAPGVMLVHGIGLVVGHSARVGTGCILFQHVTIGENIHPETREMGTPTLEADVHVGPGATILGPITIGQGTKITAGVLLTQSVPALSLVESAAPIVSVRSRAGRRDRAPTREKSDTFSPVSV